MILQPSRQGGFTLFELMITIAVAIIVTSAVTAGWRGLVDNANSQRIQSTLIQSFADARSEAVTRNQITTICPLDTNGACHADWDAPISVFTDPNNDRALTATTRMIHTHHAVPAGHLTASKSGPTERRYFQYNPDGSSKGTIGNITWCPNDGDATRAIQLRLNFGGRVIWATDSNGDGIREDSQGQELVCS